MKRNISLLGLLLLSLPVLSANSTISFELGGPGFENEYGTPASFPAFVSDGYIIDVKPGSGTTHFHVLDSIGNWKVPDRPATERGVLWHDAVADQEPLFLVPESPAAAFILRGLVVGGSNADGSQTSNVAISGFLGGKLLGTVNLPASTTYASYGETSLGALQGVAVDRLEFVSQSSSELAYYELDNIVLSAVPEPSGALYLTLGVIGLSFASRKRVFVNWPTGTHLSVAA